MEDPFSIEDADQQYQVNKSKISRSERIPHAGSCWLLLLYYGFQSF